MPWERSASNPQIAFLLCKPEGRVHEVAVLRFTCKTSIVKPWDANTGLAATCVSVMLKTHNLDTGELAAGFALPPFPLLPLNGGKTKKT